MSAEKDIVLSSEHVFMIYSQATLRDIREMLEVYTKRGRIGPMHHQLDYGKETNRIVVLMDKGVYEAVRKDLDEETFETHGFGYFNIQPMYVLKHEVQTRVLSVSIPAKLGDREAKEHILEHLRTFSSFGLFDMKGVDVRVKYTHKGFEPEHSGRALVVFPDSVPMTSVVLASKLLRDDYWNETDNFTYRCYVVRVDQQRQRAPVVVGTSTTTPQTPAGRGRRVRPPPRPLVARGAPLPLVA